MNAPHWRRRLIAICSLALTASFLSCQTARPSPVSLPAPPPPNPPVLQHVEFARAAGGLLLTLEHYRQLEANIIELRRYIAELEAQLGFYREELNGP